MPARRAACHPSAAGSSVGRPRAAPNWPPWGGVSPCAAEETPCMTNPYADPFGNPPPLPAALRPPVPPPGGIMPIVGSYGQALRLLVRHPVFWALGLATGSVRGLPGVLDGGDVI